MEGAGGVGTGGIASLVALIREHGEAVEADLAFRGIEDPRALTVRRLLVLVGALVKTPGTLLHRALSGDDWTLNDHLLALVYDQLAIANWQRSKDGSKGRNKPTPISPLAKRGTRYGGNHGRTDEEVKAFLARLNPAQH